LAVIVSRIIKMPLFFTFSANVSGTIVNKATSFVMNIDRRAVRKINFKDKCRPFSTLDAMLYKNHSFLDL